MKEGRALYIFSSHPKGGRLRAERIRGGKGGRVKRWGCFSVAAHGGVKFVMDALG